MEYAGWILVSLLAGALLNATPCVLPAIPIKLHVLLAEGGQSASRRFLTGTALLLGSLTFFLTLGALSVALQWTWGAPMGSLPFRGVLAATLALAAALLILDFGRFPVPQKMANWQGSGPIEGYFVGLGGGVLSLPCTGPFLGGVLAFTLAQSTSLSLVLFAGIGTGMALPYLVLLAFPQWAPRGGLNARLGSVVNRTLGFGLLAGALFYAQQLLPAWLQGQATVIVFVGLLALWAIIAWRRKMPTSERATALAALVAVSILGVGVAREVSEPGTLQWQPVTRAEARPGAVEGPALIEFTADWCLNCKVLERTVYRSPEVADAAGDSVAALQLDLTDFDTDAQTLLQSWGGNGLPYAVVVDGNGKVQHRLRDLFGTDRLVGALEDVADTSRDPRPNSGDNP